jgi:hypothetical protein
LEKLAICLAVSSLQKLGNYVNFHNVLCTRDGGHAARGARYRLLPAMQVDPHHVADDVHRVDAQPFDVRPHRIPDNFIPHEHHADGGTLPITMDIWD